MTVPQVEVSEPEGLEEYQVREVQENIVSLEVLLASTFSPLSVNETLSTPLQVGSASLHDISLPHSDRVDDMVRNLGFKFGH